MISKTAARFLVVAGVFNVVIWPRFAKAIVDDDRAWSGERWHSTPQAFFWVHAVLITTAIVIGLGVLVVGVRAHRSASASSSR
ncbi:SCO4848 family membrane protein [Aeromicrobium fastidiosum]|uniref:SCO4848 family membrane protein n=1 Tax=Aeromicrobium fastidiosum TaxID=52699 RepID=UPI001AE2092B|nr:hypothetical protein [Aeromicrobium fastidiosum]MBP2389845.1 multisubunit Na+/H+ antiporter MnhC subunit [Aeromicrobium fastidiosum]